MRPPLRPPLDDPRDADFPSEGVGATEPGDVAAAAPPSDLLEIIDPLPAVPAIDNPFHLSPQELLFVEAYLGVANFRAAKAYELAGFKTTGGQHRANASRMLTRLRVAKAIEARLQERVTKLRIMDGDEALEGITTLARGADIRKLFPHTPAIANLPDEIAACIKAITPTKHGHRIEFYDKGHHLEVMAKVGGKLKDTLKVEHTLEDILGRANQLEAGGAA